MAKPSEVTSSRNACIVRVSKLLRQTAYGAQEARNHRVRQIGDNDCRFLPLTLGFETLR